MPISVSPMVRVSRNSDSFEGWAQQTGRAAATTIFELKSLIDHGGSDTTAWSIIMDADGTFTEVDNATFQTDFTIILWDPNA